MLVDNLDFHGMIFDIPNIKNRNTRALVRKIKRFKDWIFSNEEYDAHYVQVGMVYVSLLERIKMKIAINLNDRGYLHDYVDMGVSLIMAGSDYSVLTPVKFSIEELKEIKEQAKELYVYVNAMYDEHDLEGLKNILMHYMRLESMD